MSRETHAFQAEVIELLDLMIHSLYSNRDVFLRELVSNASDAIDKRRFAGLTEPGLLPDGEPGIRIRVDSAARTLSVEDDGIGMSRDEVRELIGTIARSGTAEFARRLAEARSGDAPPELIGQFGVGFYASFMAASRVELETRKAGEEGATRWSSAGDGRYEIEDVERAEVGTTVTLHLRDADPESGLADYADAWTLRGILRRYSDFIAHPITLQVDGKWEEGGAPLNSRKAIWMRPESELSEQDLAEFYKHVAHDWSDPLLHVGAHIEGQIEARALLFVPSVAPWDLYHRESAHRGVQLFVKRVFIMDDCRALLPEYLRFVRGVVDSEDLPLNVSREMLQQDRQVRVIRNHLVKKVLERLDELQRDDSEKYLRFWHEFGPVLKEGLLRPEEKAERILDLVRVETSHSAEEGGAGPPALSEVVERMPDDQEFLYYMTGPSQEVLARSPQLEAFRERGVEVIFFTDQVDEVWLQQSPPEYRGKRFRAVGQGEAELGSDEERAARRKQREERSESVSGLLARLRALLQERVEEVRLSGRLTTSPACLVFAEGTPTPRMRELLRQAGQTVPDAKGILELNPDHPLLERLQAIFAESAEDPRLEQAAELLYGQALVAEGTLPPDPAGFAARIAELLQRAL